MCYDATARPPIPPIAGGAVPITEELVLTAEDGNQFAAYSATTTSPAPGIVILPDVRGLHSFYQELAERFAQAGVHATALDYFGRTAGVGQGPERGEDFEYMAHTRQTTPDTIAMDVRAAVDVGRATRIADAAPA